MTEPDLSVANVAAVGGGIDALPPGLPAIPAVASPDDGTVEIFPD